MYNFLNVKYELNGFNLGYTVKYKRDFGEWEVLHVRADQEKLTLKSLECGTRYQIYMMAFNKIGVGSPSSTMFMKTKGSRKSHLFLFTIRLD